MDNTNTNIVEAIKFDNQLIGSTIDRRKNILHIANKALAGDLYFATYMEYIKWIKNALIVTGAYKSNNNGDTE